MTIRIFNCADCGTEVHSFGFHAANDQDRCAECAWLRNIKDDKEREGLRKLLQGDKPLSITCPKCGRTSYNLNDVKQRYCGACHVFL